MAADDPIEAIEYELQEGRAYALGRAGKRVEDAIAALATGTPHARELLLSQAAEAVWEFIITRESAGFYDHALLEDAYGIPPQVMARVGVVRKR
ncbi:MAG: hypothetical protein JWP01_149 [Myxococcales bacterium]|nr:hypothetical protein [Myxococcales bacterium]